MALTKGARGTDSPAFWLDYFRRVHPDAACLSAGGCVACYLTKVPFHYRMDRGGRGGKRRHWADTTLWGNCALGAYNFEFMTDVTTEIVHTYKVDGISVIAGRVPACVTARVARTYSMITRGTICRAPRIRRIWCDANIYSGASRSSSIFSGCGIPRLRRSIRGCVSG